jgi:hypothetical protein
MHGDASLVRFQWMLTELASVVAGVERPLVLFDQRESRLDPLELRDLSMARDFLIVKNPLLAHAKIAALSNPGRDFHVVTKFKEIVGHDSHAEIEAFHDETAALEWLHGPCGNPTDLLTNAAPA